MTSREAFDSILRRLQPAVICDIGSMDASESKRFRRLCPSARVIAFEANPTNYAAITNDPALDVARIEVVHAAATDRSGVVTFHVLEPRGPDDPLRGASSLRRSAGGADVVTREVTVPALRLDEHLADAAGLLALWIDVEGAAAEVLEGLSGVADRVAAIHVELERGEFWEGQTTARTVLERLRGSGFNPVLTVPDWSGQDNVILIRRELVGRLPLAVRQGQAERYVRAARNRARRLISRFRRVAPGQAE